MKDLARIYIKAGDGGDGSVHFLHGKYQPKGGPDGGDGGSGGDIILVADENMQNLVEFNFKKKFIVKDADHGWGKNMHGKDTDDMEVKIPVGTVVYEISEEFAQANLRDREIFEQVVAGRRQMVDMTKHGQRFEAAWGGRGGKGNFQFRSATNQTPREFEEGKPGDEKWLLLEMKVVADVGIVGLPNVGKSSLLKALTNANPKIAGYPFTTLEPNLGVVTTHDKKLVIVDVPGVIEDAWEGKGIGPWFLRHLERTNLLIHALAPNVESGEELTVDGLVAQLSHDYTVVRKELEKYGNGLTDKKEIVVVNKMELVDESMRKEIEAEMDKLIHKSIVWVSAGMGEVDGLIQQLG
ncbi:GTPase ObgE [Candidatus Woesebacteria bacterium]|nr:GTPase ObgE [Candidatus Woesebacteria bacterium]